MPAVHYRDLNRPQRRALDRFARSDEMLAPLSRWPEIAPETLGQLVRLELLERRGTDPAGEALYRITDDGTRVHDEMWRDGKVPHHPQPVAASEDD